jgi:hypothetical protein
MQFPTYRDYWDRFQVMFSEDFRAELNSLLDAESPFQLAEAFDYRDVAKRSSD